jgi:hypothetical protein
MRAPASISRIQWLSNQLLVGFELGSLFLVLLLLWGGPTVQRLLLQPENGLALVMLLVCLAGLFTCAAFGTALGSDERGHGSGRAVGRLALRRVPVQGRNRLL